MPSSNNDRYSRNEALFGATGQQAIAETPVAIVGLGGLGSQVAQQLAYLGTRTFVLVDHDHVTESSMNRLVTADSTDVASATPKVLAAQRQILAINPDAEVHIAEAHLDDPTASDALKRASIIFGCVDNDVTRLQLTRLSSELALPLFDLATDVKANTNPVIFGGRVVLCTGNGCLVCLHVLDPHELARASQTSDQKDAHERIYGIERTALAGTGPMVVSINGTVASLAVTEFIAFITGLRPVRRYLIYRGDINQLRLGGDPPVADCYYCTSLWGSALSGDRKP